MVKLDPVVENMNFETLNYLFERTSQPFYNNATQQSLMQHVDTDKYREATSALSPNSFQTHLYHHFKGVKPVEKRAIGGGGGAHIMHSGLAQAASHTLKQIRGNNGKRPVSLIVSNQGGLGVGFKSNEPDLDRQGVLGVKMHFFQGTKSSAERKKE